MELKRAYALGIISGLVLAGCAGFSFKYYGLDGVTYDNGKLLGPEPKYDRPFSDCAPNAQLKHACVVMFTTDFKAFKTDYEQCKINLDACQRTCGGG